MWRNYVVSGLLLTVVCVGAFFWFFPEMFGVRVLPRTMHGLAKVPGDVVAACESSPVVVGGRVVILVSHRDGHSRGTFLEFRDFASGEAVARDLPWEFAFGSAVNDPAGKGILVFGTRPVPNGTEVGMLRLDGAFRVLERKVLFTTFETVANTSVVYDGHRYVMAYEVENPKHGQFAPRFAESDDLVVWKPLGRAFRDRDYTACPTLRFADGWYYIFYLASHKLARPAAGQEYGFVTQVARTRDFVHFEDTRFFREPVFVAPDAAGEGVNASDVDMVEMGGKTYVVYNVGNQLSAGHIRRAVFAEPLDEMLKAVWR